MNDLISKEVAIDTLKAVRDLVWDVDIPSPTVPEYIEHHEQMQSIMRNIDILTDKIIKMPSVQPERRWISCSNPPKHHKDVIVRGIEAIGNVTVHKVMQWDVDTWRPTDYAPSVMWKEWSEI